MSPHTPTRIPFPKSAQARRTRLAALQSLLDRMTKNGSDHSSLARHLHFWINKLCLQLPIPDAIGLSKEVDDKLNAFWDFHATEPLCSETIDANLEYQRLIATSQPVDEWRRIACSNIVDIVVKSCTQVADVICSAIEDSLRKQFLLGMHLEEGLCRPDVACLLSPSDDSFILPSDSEVQLARTMNSDVDAELTEEPPAEQQVAATDATAGDSNSKSDIELLRLEAMSEGEHLMDIERWFIASRSRVSGELYPTSDWFLSVRVDLQNADCFPRDIQALLKSHRSYCWKRTLTKEKLKYLVQRIDEAYLQKFGNPELKITGEPVKPSNSVLDGRFGEQLLIDSDGENAKLRRHENEIIIKGEPQVRLIKILVSKRGALAMDWELMKNENGVKLCSRDTLSTQISRIRRAGISKLGLKIKTHHNQGYSLQLMDLSEGPPPADS